MPDWIAEGDGGELSFGACAQQAAVGRTQVPPLLCAAMLLLSLCMHLGSKLPYVVYRGCKGSVSFST